MRRSSSGRPVSEEEQSLVRVAEAGGIAWVTLNRPDRRNAINHDLAESLVQSLRRVAGDETVRCVVITGAGGDFSVGGDLAAGSGGVTAPDETQAVAELRAAMESSLLLHTMPKPTVAAVSGACAGAGMSLACAADFRVVSTSVVFNTAFVRAGVSGDYGATWTLPRLVGDAWARELFLLPRRVDAQRAQQIGLATRVCAPADLERTAQDLAGELAALPPLALRWAKANLNDGARTEMEEHLGLEADRHARTSASADAAEAAASFLEKRHAVFRGM